MATNGDRQTGRPTIRDIAAHAGVSITTVSRVLNDRPDVAQETREAVLDVIRELDFAPSRATRPAQSGRTGLIGVTIPMVLGDYFAQLITGITEALYERDMASEDASEAVAGVLQLAPGHRPLVAAEVLPQHRELLGRMLVADVLGDVVAVGDAPLVRGDRLLVA